MYSSTVLHGFESCEIGVHDLDAAEVLEVVSSSPASQLGPVRLDILEQFTNDCGLIFQNLFMFYIRQMDSICMREGNLFSLEDWRCISLTLLLFLTGSLHRGGNGWAQ